MHWNRNKKVIHLCQDVCCLQNFKQSMYLHKKSFKMSVYLTQKQIELLNVVVNITKMVHYERAFRLITNQNIAGDNFHVIFYACMIFFFFLKALYNQNRINIQLHTFKPRHTGKLGINKFMSSLKKSKEHWFSSSIQ